MDPLFNQIGIYSSLGMLYEPVEGKAVLAYREAKNGQLLEEGITEAGAMSSFNAAGTAYASHGVPMIPFYVYYSMFGFQRVGDLIWAGADMRTRGFLLGATSGRTTLNGEGLQHEDGHSQLHASTVPNLVAYDPAFASEIALIVQDGVRRMHEVGEDVIYYLSLYNENYVMPPLPEGAAEGVLRGLYKCKPAEGKGKGTKVHLFGSGSIMREALRAQEILGTQFGVAADVWSATSYKELRREALDVERWNMLHPTETPRKSYLETVLAKEQGVFLAVSDNVRLVPEMIGRWVPGGLSVLGTDGFGRSESRPALRRFFEIDAESVTIAALTQLMRKGEVKPAAVAEAIQKLGVDPEKANPMRS
jgi:pyruvate dehydrogenase E1 component